MRSLVVVSWVGLFAGCLQEPGLGDSTSLQGALEQGTIDRPQEPSGQDEVVQDEVECQALSFRSDGSDTGLAVCGDPAGIRPDIVVREAQPCNGRGVGERLARAGLSCSAGQSCPEGSQCDGVTGWCALDVQCEQSSDCGEGMLCLCAALIESSAPVPHNMCVPAQCDSAQDCGSFSCAVSVGGGCATPEGAYCHGPADECQRNEDCARPGEPRRQCQYAIATGRWQCVESFFGCD